MLQSLLEAGILRKAGGLRPHQQQLIQSDGSAAAARGKQQPRPDGADGGTVGHVVEGHPVAEAHRAA
ncbi:hypothetical protein SDC9_125578 [bioreactor metagenome]|uniref:Uncharacterized protein n=1 Tax=bioreactor metagenome TaxID=1076179 RepID=A0A645CNS5_9ZZZZ